jgi:hypothetical protein
MNFSKKSRKGLRDIDKGVTFALAFERGMRRERRRENKKRKKGAKKL